MGCLETQGRCDGSGQLRRGLWKPQKKKRGEGNIYVPYVFALLSRKGWWKLELATSSCLMTHGLNPVTPGTWVTSSGRLQSWPALSCPLGSRFNTRSSQQHARLLHGFSAPQLLAGVPFGPSATPPRPALLQNAALFQTIPHPVLSLQC